ncbi:phage holin family protein [Lysinibacillus capsici]|uniref:phage holin family protein n=1 Tax=Lysinibacillus capsici TaxID=2115968 RepID=UPI0028AA8253|nr:phage holin family protein [Lysinibacillus capsici]
MEKWIAGISEVIVTLISYSVDGLGMVVTVLIGFMAIDYLTRIMGCIVNQNLNSRTGFNGIIRKIYYLMLVGSVYFFSVVISGSSLQGMEQPLHFVYCNLIDHRKRY